MRWILMMLLALGMIACESEATPTPEPEVDDPAFSEAILESDTIGGRLLVNHPADWAAQDTFSSIQLAGSEDTLTRLQGTPEDAEITLETGEFFVVVNAFPLDSLGLLNVNDDSSPADVLTEAMNVEIEGVMPTEADIETFEGGAYAVGTTTTTDDTTLDVVNVVAPEGEAFVLLSLVAPEGEGEQYLETLQTIVTDADYTPAENPPSAGS